jgi:arylformamidase
MDDGVYRGYSAAALEEQYSPRASVPNHEAITADAVARSAAYRETAANAVYDVAYGPHRHETMDIFRPADPDGAPVHVFIHGGYWRSRFKEEFSFVAGPLVDAGAVVAVINYALCPEVTLEEIVRQTRAACAYLWRNPDVHRGNRRRMHIAGHSAGGHLAAMLMTTDWPAFGAGLPRDMVKSATLLSGLYDLEPLLQTSVQADVRLTADDARRLSPVLLKPATDAPIVIAAGGAESDEFRRQSRILADAWKDYAPVEHFDPPGLNHFTILTETATADSRLTEARLRLMGLR